MLIYLYEQECYDFFFNNEKHNFENEAYKGKCVQCIAVYGNVIVTENTSMIQ